MNADESQERSAETTERAELTSPSAQTIAPAPSITAPEVESRFHRFLRRLVRWVLGILILIGLGFVSAVWLLYLPMRREAAAKAAELSAAQARIEELEKQLAARAQIEQLHQQALEQLKQADFQNNLLNLQMEVASARIYLFQDRKELAGVAMQNARSILKALQTTATPAQRADLNEMEARLTLALSSLEKDLYAAQSDLDVLARKLNEFSASLGTSP